MFKFATQCLHTVRTDVIRAHFINCIHYGSTVEDISFKAGLYLRKVCRYKLPLTRTSFCSEALLTSLLAPVLNAASYEVVNKHKQFHNDHF